MKVGRRPHEWAAADRPRLAVPAAARAAVRAAPNSARGVSTPAALRPAVNGFLKVIGVLVFLWVGFESSTGASEEMHNPRPDGSAFVFFVFLITKGSLADFFSVMIALAISSTALCYVFVFPALVVLRRKYPYAPRPYRVPGGMAGAWAAALITELFVVVTAVTLLWPGAINALFGESYSIKRSWGVSRVFFESVTLGVFGVMVLLGVVFWAVGGANRRRGLTGEAEFCPEEAASAGHPPV